MARTRAAPVDEGSVRAPLGAVPTSYHELCSWIEHRKATLPKRLREVAAFVLAHPDEIAFGPLAKLTEVARIPSSAFVRLAQSIGYRGFPELQAVIRTRLVASGERSAIRSADDDLSRYVRNMRNALQRLDERTSRSMISRAGCTLAGAETVFLLGQNDTALVALHIGHVLTAAGVRNISVCALPGAPDATLAFASAKDAAIVADLTTSDRMTAAQVAGLASRDVPLVLLTDSRMHPLASPAVPWFEVLEDLVPGTPSHALLECLIHAIVSEMRSVGRAPPLHSALSDARPPRSRPERATVTARSR